MAWRGEDGQRIAGMLSRCGGIWRALMTLSLQGDGGLNEEIMLHVLAARVENVSHIPQGICCRNLLLSTFSDGHIASFAVSAILRS